MTPDSLADTGPSTTVIGYVMVKQNKDLRLTVDGAVIGSADDEPAP
jgi:hypothetical protein